VLRERHKPAGQNGSGAFHPAARLMVSIAGPHLPPIWITNAHVEDRHVPSLRDDNPAA
jgi:hypothetical protein